ncbi:MAG: Beta-galactosidase, partial [uncultured Lysobacter sp.]
DQPARDAHAAVAAAFRIPRSDLHGYVRAATAGATCTGRNYGRAIRMAAHGASGVPDASATRGLGVQCSKRAAHAMPHQRRSTELLSYSCARCSLAGAGVLHRAGSRRRVCEADPALSESAVPGAGDADRNLRRASRPARKQRGIHQDRNRTGHVPAGIAGPGWAVRARAPAGDARKPLRGSRSDGHRHGRAHAALVRVRAVRMGISGELASCRCATAVRAARV